MQKFRLSQLIHILDTTLKQIFSDFDFWLETEVSSIKENKGKIYLDFVEFDVQTNQVIGKARGIVFDINIWLDFIKKVGIDNEQVLGKKLLVHGKINFHKDYGFSIIINEISSEFFVGQLVTNQTQIRKELQKLGIYDNNKQTQDPFPPYKLAILSSKTSEGLNDFLTIINNANIKIDYKLFDVPVHGNEAQTGVYNGLKQIYNEIKNGEKYSFVLIVRGGGGSQGIIWQNDINIAKGICYMGIPVILAVGHTKDVSILDEISKYSLKTPTEAAYFVVSKYQFFKQDIKDSFVSINKFIHLLLLKYSGEIKFFYENINLSVKLYKNKLTLLLKEYYSSILAQNPTRLTQKGYGLLKDSNGKFLSKKQIKQLKKNDKVLLEIYDVDLEFLLLNDSGDNK